MGRDISIRRPISLLRTQLEITPGFFAFALLGALISPQEVIAAMLLASAMHECGHLLALRAYRVRVERFRLGALGAEIRTRGTLRLSYGKELIVTLSGVAVNLLFALPLAMLSERFGWRWGTIFAGAHIVLGTFNLLPVPPLDGGRALRLVLSYFFGPYVGTALSLACGVLVSAALAAGALHLTLRGAGGFLLLAALGLLFGSIAQVRLACGRQSV